MGISTTAGATIAALVLAAFGNSLGAQPVKPRSQSLLIESMYGADLYGFYCASCHGIDGKGSGSTAPALKIQPSNLSTLSRRNGGSFPRRRLEDYVTCVRETPAHGSAAMPVWGPIFRALDPKDASNKVRIANIVDHIELLQTRP